VVDRPDRLIEDRDAKYREAGVGGDRSSADAVGKSVGEIWRVLGEGLGRVGNCETVGERRHIPAAVLRSGESVVDTSQACEVTGVIS
jgi:hypothetical protein